MKALKITKDETIKFNGEHVTNGHWLFTPGANTLSDKSLQALIDAGMHFERMRHYTHPLTGDEAAGFDGARVIPDSMGDECLLHPTRFTYTTSGNEVTTCRVFKHSSGRIVVVDERYNPLWEERACFQSEPLSAIRIENNVSEVVAVVMPINVTDVHERVMDLANMPQLS